MEIEDIICQENKVYSKPELLEEVHMHYCPGCSHGVIHKLLAEVIQEMGLTEKTVGISPEVAPCSHITMWMLTGWRRHTDAPPP